ncbi:MAG: hypothetical protein AB1324_08210 [Candidatus Micrarchaeota archaeon]
MNRNIVLALLLVPLAGAEGRFFEYKEDSLGFALDNVECKRDFTVGVMESMMEHLDGADSLSEHVATLDDDVDALAEYADEADALGFRAYVRDSFMPHMLDAREAIRLERLEAAPVDPSVRMELGSDYNELLEGYETCNFESMEGFAWAKIDAYNEALEAATDRAESLASKGISTDAIEDLIATAQDEIVDPLEREVESAENASQVREALSKYCLFSGCPAGTNFHFGAKVAAEALGSTVDALEEVSDDAEADAYLAEAQGHLEDAQDVLEEIGDGVYSDGQGRTLWSAIHSAASSIKDALYELRSAR